MFVYNNLPARYCEALMSLGGQLRIFKHFLNSNLYWKEEFQIKKKKQNLKIAQATNSNTLDTSGHIIILYGLTNLN